MRVAIDARWNYHPSFQYYLHQLLTELPALAAERGIEIVAYESPERPNAVTRPNLMKISVKSGCYAPMAQLELRIRIRKDKVDLFHCPFYWIPFLATCPVIATVHDLIPFLFPSYGYVHRKLVQAGYRAGVHAATHVVCLSDHTRQDVLNLLKVPPKKVTRIYNCVDTNLFNDASAPNEEEYLRERYGITKPYVLTFSASNWVTKNITGALAAIERARDLSRVQFQTVVAGPPEGLQKSGVQSQLRNTVITGFVPSEDRPKLYRNAAVFITLSRYEGFGCLISDAMSCGTASISSRGGSLPEIAGDGAVICNEDDVASVAENIVQLLADSEKRKTLSGKAIERAKVFSPRALAKNVLELYEKILLSEKDTKLQR